MTPRVLIADDNDDFRQSLRGILLGEQLDLFEARTGEDTLAMIAELDPDVVLLDWCMPGGGLTIARQLVENHGMEDRVIMVTALDDGRDRQAARQVGVAAYLVKPPDPDELLAAVRSAVQSSSRARRSRLQTPVSLDRAQLEALQMFSDTERSELVMGVTTAIDRLLDEVAHAVGIGDLTRLAEQAHRGRNEAGAVGARALADTFGLLQTQARLGERELACQTVRLLRESWPDARDAICDSLVQPTSRIARR